jgi:hypothetical protein
MGRDTDVLSAMVETGCSREQIAAVIRVLKEGRSSGAARQARYRARLKENRNGDVTHNVTGDVTGSPDKERSPYIPPKEINPSQLSSLRSDRAGVTPTPKKTVSSKRTQLTENAEPSDRDRGVAAKAAMTDATIDLEWQRFRAHHIAKGSLMANWGQAWVTWVTNWKAFGAKQAQPEAVNGAGSKYDWSVELAIARQCEIEAEERNRENRRVA